MTWFKRWLGGSDRGAPDAPSDLPKPLWKDVVKGAAREFQEDNLMDTAAALTYYSVLSIFPALLIIVSIVGMLGRRDTTELIDNVSQFIPASAHQILRSAIEETQRGQNTAGFTAILGLLGAVWSASGFVGAFMRASNTVFDVPECRPFWKTIPIRIGLTVVLLVLMAATALIVILSGDVAKNVGDLIGLTSTTVTVWNYAKWPVLVIILMLMLAILYWGSPNAKQPGFRWVTPGGLVGIALWLLASGGLALYVANFSSFNRTYGALAGVIVFLVWIWLSNLAILFGAEFDAELARARAQARGLPKGKEPYLETRDP